MKPRYLTDPKTKKTRNITQWAKHLGITEQGMFYRINAYGETNPKIFKKPRCKKVKHPKTGELKTIHQWSKKLGIVWTTFDRRLKALGEQNLMCWTTRKRMDTQNDKTLERKRKLTVEILVNAVPKIGSITLKQLARKVNCGRVLTSEIAKQAIEQGEIEMFVFDSLTHNFRRVKK
jgi:hypothetical protein